MTEEEKRRDFLDFIMGNNRDFYKSFLEELSDEEREAFFRKNPDFEEELKRE